MNTRTEKAMTHTHMTRSQFHHNDLTLSYLDTGGEGQTLIALHALWMEAATYTRFAAALAPEWRVIALDQRGHGHADHAQGGGYAREDYIGDVAALFEHLEVDKAVLLGNSLGGVNAYQFAAYHPERVKALVIEDLGAAPDADASFVLAWDGTFPSREALEEHIGQRLAPYLLDSFRATPNGWRLAFEPRDMLESQLQLNGDHWADWLATGCPALLIRGRESRITTQDHLEQMAARRPHTRLVTLDGGHVVHQDNPNGFADIVREFLHDL